MGKLRRHQNQIEDLIERLGGAPGRDGSVVFPREPSFDHFHDVELDRAGVPQSLVLLTDPDPYALRVSGR